jgi:esterase/lipase superfamily enzyme
MQLSSCLTEKGVRNTLHLWEGEAHKAKYWASMLQRFL